MNEFLSELAKSGPWALVAGFLLWTVIKAWQADREKVLPFFEEMRDVMGSLVIAVNKNTESNNEMVKLLRDEMRGDDRRK